ncbi:MAG: 5-methyltetrahydrofolate--homocysteine methyltransferase [Herbinix sp.]|jgi:homocysteine S-methyltransferase|nr:5-methyltetrahydrofolate--homocysteine methyltransferase [Herbinix sp.]
MLIKEYLKTHRLIPDGSMGTYYSKLMNQPGAVSEYANLSAPEMIEQIHMDYLSSGARLLRTNTFAANRAVLHINIDEQRRLIKAACDNARNAAVKSEVVNREGEQVWIFGDIGPILQDADTDEEDLLEEYRLLCDIFIEEGLDGIHFETFSKLTHIEKLFSYIKSKNKNMFILVSFSINKNGYTVAGISAKRLMEKAGQIDEIDACGFNCGVGSGHMVQLMQRVAFPVNKISYVAANAGYPEQMQNRMIFMDNVGYFTKNSERIAELGVDIIGGCCGTTPEYISNMVERINTKATASARNITGTTAVLEKSEMKGNAFFERLQSGKKVIAVELDPPYDANTDQIMECAHILKSLGVDIITFADSPMGRSRVDSILMSAKIAAETGMKVMPHICCRDRNMISMRASLLGAYIHDIRNLLIVTGDPVPGDSRVSTTGVFDYNSVQLMEYVREMNMEHLTAEPFYFGGALNYGRGMLDKVIDRMKRKIEAGATYFLTQPIYCREDAERIRGIKERLDTKILCGIMPLVSYRNATFIKNEISGIHLPEEILNRYYPEMSREEAENVGAAIAIEMMELLDGIADGYYFMLPFNRVSLMDKIIKGGVKQ